MLTLENASGFSKIGSIKIPILSAKKIFYKKPTENKINPNLTFSLLIVILFFNCGKSSLSLKIGPAISWGKNKINSFEYPDDLDLISINQNRENSITINNLFKKSFYLFEI